VRLARISHADGVSFAALQSPALMGEGVDPDGPASRRSGGGDVCAEIAEHPFGDPTFTGRTWPLADVRLLAPILPSKVVCIGKNYADHVSEMGGETPPAPLIFMKPSTTVIGPGLPIRMPADSQRVDYEGELAVVIGVPCRDVPEARARDVALGHPVGNDVTARDLQQADGQWTRAKGYDSFCPLGPWIETTIDPGDLAIRTELDGEVRQDSRTSLLLHPVEELIAYISRVMTLLPGDVILTGTPAGVGPMAAGQQVSVTVEGLGTLTNPVQAR
jgi:2-keto-4-pentenoate hydratase/2-oxohepta-3-ene-1,7-dioic acid hydratase in catechol pathway